jgi:hypothetical protein
MMLRNYIVNKENPSKIRGTLPPRLYNDEQP